MDLKYNVLQNSRFYLFEGNKECEESLKEKKLMYFMDVLADPGRGEVDFYNGTNTGDSYYQETTKIYEGFQPIRVPTITLDELIDKHNLPIPDFIKLDTQGSELDILKGVSKVMGFQFSSEELQILNDGMLSLAVLIGILIDPKKKDK